MLNRLRMAVPRFARGIATSTYPHKCPPLPYAADALSDKGISEQTLNYHHGKHHNGYVTKLNTLLENKPELHKENLVDLLLSQKGGIFNCAAQSYNHEFYWNSMSPRGGGDPTGPIADRIKKQWGSFEKFKELFTATALNHFASGWAWLVIGQSGNLAIVDSHDAGCPLTSGEIPVLACDVWEHAYYIDTRNDRGAYLKNWWNTVNWEWANNQLQGTDDSGSKGKKGSKL